MILSFILAFFICGCGGGNEKSPGDMIKTVEVNDEIDDVTYGYVDLKNGNVEFNGNIIRVNIEMKNLPDKLLFDYTDYIEPNRGYMEYLWGVVFDINNDGIKSKDDIEVAIMYSKVGNYSEAEYDILEKTRKYILKVTENNGISSLVTLTNVQKNGNKIVITFTKNMHDSLNKINSNCKLLFETYYNQGGSSQIVQDFME